MISMVPIFVLPIYGLAFMWIFLDVRLGEIPPKRRCAAGLFLLAVITCNVLFFVTQGRPMYAKFYFFLVHIPLIILFGFLSKYRGWRVLFVFLTLFLSCALPPVIEGVIRLYRPTGVWDDVIVYTSCCALMLLLVKRLFGGAFFYMLQHAENRDFAKFCVIPLFYFLSTFLMSGHTFALQNQPINFGIKQLPFAFTIFTYYLLLYIFKNTREKMVVKNEQEMTATRLLAAEQQMAELKAAQHQTVIYRHDMRHHLSLLKGFAEEGELPKIHAYLAEVEADIDAITPVRYSENETVNLLLSSFDARAKKESVVLCVDVALQSELPVRDTELCALLSNALENAITAAAQVEDEKLRRVYLRAVVNDGKLLLSTENAYAGFIELEGELPKSQRREAGHGFGVKSMVSIVERHGGLYSFETADGVFVLQLMLPLEQ